MRRFSLIVTILIGGALFSLPFRRPLPVDPPVENPAGKSKGLDEASIEMLVREVTRDVEVPVFFDPSASQDAIPFATPSVDSQLPLTYEDAAIPLAEDPVYERRFNATLAGPSRAVSTGPATRSSEDLAELERRFDAKPVSKPLFDSAAARRGRETHGVLPPTPVQHFAQTQRPAEAPPGTQPAADRPPAEFGSSFQRKAIDLSRQEGLVRRNSEHSAKFGGHAASVLSELPAPDLEGDTNGTSRVKHWIRQPD